MLRLARIISNILNPLIIFVLIATSLVYYFTGSLQSSFRWFLVVSAFAFVLTLLILYLVKKKVFSNFDVSNRKQRPVLFLIAASIVFILLLLSVMFQAGNDVLVIFFVALAGITGYSVVNTKIKASAHLGVFIVFASIMTFLYDIRFAFLYLVAAILAWARVKEKEHTVPEVFVGTLLGIILSALLLYLIQ